MRTKFPAYYRIHSEDLLARFDDCIFMFDSCALLDIYRMKKEVTEDVFSVMEHLKEQIRIPYHVAEEYFENIHTVLKKQLENIDASRTEFNKFINDLESKRSQPYIGVESTRLLSRLKKQVEKDFKQQEAYLEEQLLHGGYQNRLSEILEGKVLDAFNDEQLAEINEEGVKRYEDKIPPGYKDASKSTNRYGDLINWKEILRYAKDSGRCIIIVSSEIKEDWVIRERGKSVCLRYELMKEFYQTVGNHDQLIHFLSLDRFLEFAREKDGKVISEETVNIVKDYVEVSQGESLYDTFISKYFPSNELHKSIEEQMKGMNTLQEKINPLKKRYEELDIAIQKMSGGFPKEVSKSRKTVEADDLYEKQYTVDSIEKSSENE